MLEEFVTEAALRLDVTGPHARAAWQNLVDSADYAQMNAILRFLFAAVIIDESRAGKGRFDYDRIDIGPESAMTV